LAEKSRADKNLVILLPININTASEETLDKALDGIGLAKAKAIVAYRDEHGPFASVEELTKVKGIGPGTLDRNAGRMSVK
ncbi:MAG TPA: helix-hairpin-helix domain-containing protein, partial [Dongiaceae bacterium]|nr:helix-hairpin-helix domain-containing protein [Dongiaceae bacterium]